MCLPHGNYFILATSPAVSPFFSSTIKGKEEKKGQTPNGPITTAVRLSIAL
jgi:hypothetical protein